MTCREITRLAFIFWPRTLIWIKLSRKRTPTHSSQEGMISIWDVWAGATPLLLSFCWTLRERISGSALTRAIHPDRFLIPIITVNGWVEPALFGTGVMTT